MHARDPELLTLDRCLRAGAGQNAGCELLHQAGDCFPMDAGALLSRVHRRARTPRTTPSLSPSLPRSLAPWLSPSPSFSHSRFARSPRNGRSVDEWTACGSARPCYVMRTTTAATYTGSSRQSCDVRERGDTTRDPPDSLPFAHSLIRWLVFEDAYASFHHLPSPTSPCTSTSCIRL